MACNECYGTGSISDWYRYGEYTCIEGGDSNNPNDPCNSTIDPIVLYLSGSTNLSEPPLIYTSIKNSTKYTGTFFPAISQSTQLPGASYLEVTNGVGSDGYNNICPPDDLTWDKLDYPSDISIHGTKVLAAYAGLNVVLLFDGFSNTRPTGSVIAGIYGVPARNVSESILQPGETNRVGTVALNAPTNVVWRDDGERFAVYSAGNAKSMTIWSSSGEWLQTIGVNKDNHNSPDNPFGYQGFSGSNNVYSAEPSTPLSESYDATTNTIRYRPIADAGFTYELTPELYAGRPNNYSYSKAEWIITKMEYQVVKTGVGGTYSPDYDILYVGQVGREEQKRAVGKIDFYYKINAFIPHFNKKFQIFAFYETSDATGQDVKNVGDVISDFTITKKQHLPGTNNSGVRQEIVILTPNSYYTGSGLPGFNTYTYYDVRELTLSANFENNTLSTTKLRSNTEGSRIGPYPIVDTSGNYLFRKNVRANVGYVNGSAYVFIAQGDEGFIKAYLEWYEPLSAAAAIAIPQIFMSKIIGGYIVDEFVEWTAWIFGGPSRTDSLSWSGWGSGSAAGTPTFVIVFWVMVVLAIITLWLIGRARRKRTLKKMERYDEGTSKIDITFGSGTTDSSYSWNFGVTNHTLFDWGSTMYPAMWMNQATGSTDTYLYSIDAKYGLYKGVWNNVNSKILVYQTSSLFIES